jgi:hypothetical protein
LGHVLALLKHGQNCNATGWQGCWRRDKNFISLMSRRVKTYFSQRGIEEH